MLDVLRSAPLEAIVIQIDYKHLQAICQAMLRDAFHDAIGPLQVRRDPR
ncbi:hypothetical protein [Dyella humicola]|nr:hypothetical protein [Dyella humicola]